MSIIDIVNELNNSTILKNIVYTVHFFLISRCTDCIMAALSYVRTIHAFNNDKCLIIELSFHRS